MNFNILIILLLVVSCQKAKEPPGFGLTKIEIEMDAETLGELNNTSQAKRPFAARVYVAGEAYWAKINYAGKSTLDAPKKSIQLSFNSGSYNNLKSIRLSSQYVDDSLIRSIIGFEMFNSFGVDSPNSEPVAVYMNKKYLGLYQLIEPIDDNFFKSRGLETNEVYKATFANADFSYEFLGRLSEAYSIKNELKDDSAIKALWEIVLDENPESYDKLAALLDIDQYLSYVAVAVTLNHWDGFDNNYYLARLSDGKFRIFPWDLDRVYDPGRSLQGIWGENGLTEKLMKHPEYRELYLEKLEQVLSQNTSEVLLDKINGLSLQVREAYETDQILVNRFSVDDSHGILKQSIEAWLNEVNHDFNTFIEDM